MKTSLLVVSLLTILAACDRKEDAPAPAATVSAGPGGAAVQAGNAGVTATPGAASVHAGGVSVNASADGGARIVVPGIATIQAK